MSMKPVYNGILREQQEALQKIMVNMLVDMEEYMQEMPEWPEDLLDVVYLFHDKIDEMEESATEGYEEDLIRSLALRIASLSLRLLLILQEEVPKIPVSIPPGVYVGKPANSDKGAPDDAPGADHGVGGAA